LSPAQVLDVVANADEHRALVTVPDTMMSLAIGKEGQNARLAAKLTGWNIDIQSQSAAQAREAGEDVRTSSFAPAAPGEEADIDLVAEYVEPEPEPLTTPLRTAAPQPAVERAAALAENGTGDEDVVFAAAVASMPVPDREEREAEDYGEEEEDGEDYEIPAAVVPEERPSAIRFAEDVLPGGNEPETAAARRPAARRRAPRVLDEVEEDMEDIDYSGRIH
jgi:N utilization substance protein A